MNIESYINSVIASEQVPTYGTISCGVRMGIDVRYKLDCVGYVLGKSRSEMIEQSCIAAMDEACRVLANRQLVVPGWLPDEVERGSIKFSDMLAEGLRDLAHGEVPQLYRGPDDESEVAA
jgi:hypothetical protein